MVGYPKLVVYTKNDLIFLLQKNQGDVHFRFVDLIFIIRTFFICYVIIIGMHFTG